MRFPRFLKASSLAESPDAVESRLLAAYQEAHRVYALRIAELGQAPSRTFADLLEQVEQASHSVATARAALDACRPVQRKK